MVIRSTRVKELLTPEQYKKFQKFMHGQTVREENGEFLIYEDDFLRFVKGLLVIDNGTLVLRVYIIRRS